MLMVCQAWHGWMDGAPAGSESAAVEPTGIWGGPRRGTVLQAGAGIKVPTVAAADRGAQEDGVGCSIGGG